VNHFRNCAPASEITIGTAPWLCRLFQVLEVTRIYNDAIHGYWTNEQLYTEELFSTFTCSAQCHNVCNNKTACTSECLVSQHQHRARVFWQGDKWVTTKWWEEKPWFSSVYLLILKLNNSLAYFATYLLTSLLPYFTVLLHLICKEASLHTDTSHFSDCMTSCLIALQSRMSARLYGVWGALNLRSKLMIVRNEQFFDWSIANWSSQYQRGTARKRHDE